MPVLIEYDQIKDGLLSEGSYNTRLCSLRSKNAVAYARLFAAIRTYRKKVMNDLTIKRHYELPDLPKDRQVLVIVSTQHSVAFVYVYGVVADCIENDGQYTNRTLQTLKSSKFEADNLVLVLQFGGAITYAYMESRHHMRTALNDLRAIVANTDPTVDDILPCFVECFIPEYTNSQQLKRILNKFCISLSIKLSAMIAKLSEDILNEIYRNFAKLKRECECFIAERIPNELRIDSIHNVSDVITVLLHRIDNLKSMYEMLLDIQS